jgi:uncharacterized membrane protein YhaH (DUF805 family)
MKWYLQVFKKYAVFNGRARRKEYWYYVLFYILFAIGLEWLYLTNRLTFLYPIFILTSLIPTIAVSVRRMHDVNKSGWFILIPIYNLILYCTNGTKGPNQYGPDPKNLEFEEFLNESEPGLPQ